MEPNNIKYLYYFIIVVKPFLQSSVKLPQSTIRSNTQLLDRGNSFSNTEVDKTDKKATPSNGNAQIAPNVARKILAYDNSDVGKSIEVFSFRKNNWESLEIIDYEPSKQFHKCQLPSGIHQWLDLSKKPARESQERA